MRNKTALLVFALGGLHLILLLAGFVAPYDPCHPGPRAVLCSADATAFQGRLGAPLAAVRLRVDAGPGW